MYKRLIPFLLAGQLIIAAAVNYSYDAAGRLTRVDYGGGNAITYTYDKAGNLLSRVTEAPPVSGGVITSVNTAGGGTDIGPNTWVEIKGTNLVPANTPASGVICSDAPEFTSGRMPTLLKGASATVNGKAAYIYFFCSGTVAGSICSKDQINVLTPLDNAEGPVQIVVNNGSAPSAPFTVIKKALSPAFLLFKSPYIAATHTDYSLLGPSTLYPGASTPAKANELVVLYGVGFGLTGSVLTEGSSSQSGLLQPLPVCSVGGNPAVVAFAGLISPGLYQINLTIPSGTPSRDNAVSCTFKGASTPDAQITVGQ